MDADRVRLQDLPLGTILTCHSEDITSYEDHALIVRPGDMSVIVRHTEYSTTFVCLTQGFIYESNYGRHSPYAKMCCYTVYELPVNETLVRPDRQARSSTSPDTPSGSDSRLLSDGS